MPWRTTSSRRARVEHERGLHGEQAVAWLRRSSAPPWRAKQPEDRRQQQAARRPAPARARPNAQQVRQATRSRRPRRPRCRSARRAGADRRPRDCARAASSSTSSWPTSPPSSSSSASSARLGGRRFLPRHGRRTAASRRLQPVEGRAPRSASCRRASAMRRQQRPQQAQSGQAVCRVHRPHHSRTPHVLCLPQLSGASGLGSVWLTDGLSATRRSRYGDDRAERETEIRRYARHIVLPEFGGIGQLRLKAATGPGDRCRRARQPGPALSRRRRGRARSGSWTTIGSIYPTCNARSCSRPSARASRRPGLRWSACAASIRMSRSWRITLAARRGQRSSAGRRLRSGRRRQRQSADPAGGARRLPGPAAAAGERLGAGPGWAAHHLQVLSRRARILACAACSTTPCPTMRCRPAPKAGCSARSPG